MKVKIIILSLLLGFVLIITDVKANMPIFTSLVRTGVMFWLGYHLGKLKNF